MKTHPRMRQGAGTRGFFYRLTSFLLALFLLATPVATTFAQESSATASTTSSGGTSTSTPSVAPTPTSAPDASSTAAPNDTSTATPDSSGTLTESGNTDGAPQPDVTPVDDNKPQGPPPPQTASIVETPSATNRPEKKILPETDSSTGALVYSYPIQVPPGRNGMQPDLKLQYNSQQGQNIDNIIGYGWTINIPYITRLNKSGTDKLYTDNYFSSSMDGELIEISSGVYAPKSENGAFLKYEYNGTMWTVTDKKGTVFKFGTANTERQDDSTHANTYKWMLEETKDTNGNYISYTYTKDSGQIYPDTITYTKNGATAGIFTVAFSTQARSDVVTKYNTGFPVTTNYTISLIETKVNGTWVRKYTPSYSAGDNGNRSLLSQIVESGKVGAVTTTLEPIKFNYQVPTTGWTGSGWAVPTPLSAPGVYMGDANGDGYSDVIHSYGDSLNTSYQRTFLNDFSSSWPLSTSYVPPAYFYTYHTVSGDQGFRVADANGDGYLDILEAVLSGDGGWMNDKTSAWNFDNTWSPNITFSPGGSQPDLDQGSRVADINGDGLPDLLQAKYFGAVLTTNAFTNIGAGWSSASYTSPVDMSLYSFLVDVNGDQLADIMVAYTYQGTDTRETYINQGDGTWVLDTNYASPTIFIDMYTNWDQGARMADVNGDGLIDIVQSAYTYRGAWLNTGSGWVYSSAWYVQPDTADGHLTNTDLGVRIEDINADGLPDVVKGTDNGTGGVDSDVRINNGIKADLLSKIIYPESGYTDITYKSANTYKDSGGALLNPLLPIQIDVVDSITNNDNLGVVGLGTAGTTNYSYEGGEYYFNNSFDRQFAGFSIVTKTDPALNVTKTYFHQGNATNDVMGESVDDEYKIGKPYRVEQYDSSNNLYKDTINRWDSTQIGSSNAYFVSLGATVTETYDGNGTHKDTAEDFSYDNTNGNLTMHTEMGEAGWTYSGWSINDVGTDTRTTTYDYAVPTGATKVIGLPSHVFVYDYYNNALKESNYYYDSYTSTLGSVSLGNLTKEEDWMDSSNWATTLKHYDGTYGLVDYSTDARGKVTNYTFDTNNLYPATVTDPNSHHVDYTYDYASGKVTSTTDMNNFVYTTDYDGLNRPVSSTTPDPAGGGGQVRKTDYVYDDNSVPNSIQVTQYLDGTNAVDTYSYSDGLGRLIQDRKESETLGTFNVRTLTYNKSGQLDSESLKYGELSSSYNPALPVDDLRTFYVYDPLGRVISSKNAEGTTGYEYDDWHTSVTDVNGHIKTFYKDAFDNLVQVDEIDTTNAATYTTRYTWNLNSKLLNITDAEGNIRDFTYDGLGNRLTATDLHDPVDTTYFGSWSYEYDHNGNLTKSTDPRTKVIDYTYDDASRILTENYPTSAGTDITYAYDSCTNGVGKLCTVTMTTGANSAYTYDKVSNIASDAKTISSVTYTTSYTYDRQGNPLLITSPSGGQSRNTYNAGGLLEKVEFKKSGGSFATIVDRIKHSPMDQVTTEDYANTVTTTNTYNDLDLYRLMNKTSSDGTTDFQNIDYKYDAVGNVTKITDNSVTNAGKIVDYTYDDLDRLLTADTGTSAANSQDYLQTFTYSPIGNIITGPFGTYHYQGNGGVLYANPHAPTSISAIGYTYDNAGNLSGDGTNFYRFNYKSQLDQTTLPLKTITYLYDHSGARMKTDDGTLKTVYPSKYYDKETSAGKVTDYVYAGNQLVATVDANGTHYVHADHLTGSNIVTDSFPKEEQLLDYYPFGDVRINEQITTLDLAKKFTGHYYDTDSDLNYAGARYYQAKKGQFISEDNVFLGLGDDNQLKSFGTSLSKVLLNPQNLNSYSYVRNNPLSHVDQTGNCIEDLCVGEGIALAVIYAPQIAAFLQGLTTPLGQYAVSSASENAKNGNYVMAGIDTVTAGEGSLIAKEAKAVVGFGERLAANKIAGQVGEARLAKILGEGEQQAYHATSQGKRFVDFENATSINEAKNGYVSLTQRIKTQALKDAEISQQTGKQANWYLFKGGSESLKQFMGDLGIKVMDLSSKAE